MEDADIQKQLEYLEKQKQIEELQKELAEIKDLIDAEKKQQEEALKPKKRANEAPLPNFTTKSASRAQIDEYNRKYAGEQEQSDFSAEEP